MRTGTPGAGWTAWRWLGEPGWAGSDSEVHRVGKLSQRDPNWKRFRNNFHLDHLVWDLWFGISILGSRGLGTLAWDLFHGIIGFEYSALDHWLGVFGLGSLSWDP